MKRGIISILCMIALANLCEAQCTPVFTGGPDDIHTYPVPGQCTAAISFNNPTFSGCPAGTLIQTAGLPSGSAFPAGTTTNTFDVMEKSVIFEEDFADNSAGWTMDSEWEIGPATASSCGLSWSYDPGTDNTPTADNGIAGVVIGGCASTILHTSYYYITSPAINTSGSSYLTLDLYRWLNSDYAPYMSNRVEVWDGTAWQILWQTGGSPVTNDNAWTLMNFNIQPYTNAALQVRIGFNVGNNGAFTVGSWNLDDISIYDFVSTGVSYSFDVNVSNQMPSISCPGNISAPNTSGLACSEQVNYSATISSCIPATTVPTLGLPTGAEFPIGTTTVELTTTQDNPTYTLFLKEDFMDNSAGWLTDTEWGIAPAATSTCGVNPDPGMDHTSTADNGIAGVVPGGCASTSVHGYYYLTSPVVDVSAATNLSMSYWRWLNSDVTPYMQNTIEVFDGASWQTLWLSGSTAVSDTSWQELTYDLTPYINTNLQIRFGHQVGSSGGADFSSWNIDDIVIFGNVVYSTTCTFDVTVDPFQASVNTAICQGDTFTLGTQTLTTGGTYTETWMGGGTGGCDSTVVLTLTVNPVYNTNTSTQICSGDTLLFGSQVLNAAGVYTELFTSALTGCDSTVVLTLAIAPLYDDTLIQTICPGDSILFGGIYYNASGSYINNTYSTAGCDSTTVLFLSINVPTFDTISETICNGESYVIGSQSYNSAGIYTVVLTNMYGCDSTVTVDLSMVATPVINVNGVSDEIYGNDGAIDVQILSIDPYTVNWNNGSTAEDQTGLSGGVYVITVTNSVTGCVVSDSVFINSSSGLMEHLESSVELFPNPNNGRFVITAGPYTIDRITLVDPQGRLVKRYEDINDQKCQIDISQLEKGDYQLIIETEQRTITRNVIIL